jgi:hypothetical protein
VHSVEAFVGQNLAPLDALLPTFRDEKGTAAYAGAPSLATGMPAGVAIVSAGPRDRNPAFGAGETS